MNTRQIASKEALEMMIKQAEISDEQLVFLLNMVGRPIAGAGLGALIGGGVDLASGDKIHWLRNSLFGAGIGLGQGGLSEFKRNASNADRST